VDSPYYSKSELCGGVVMVPFFKVLPLESNALLTILHPPLKNVLQTVDHFVKNFLPWTSLFVIGKAQKLHEARSELNSVFGLEKVDHWNPSRTSTI
jgi:hypothetical protein